MRFHQELCKALLCYLKCSQRQGSVTESQLPYEGPFSVPLPYWGLLSDPLRDQHLLMPHEDNIACFFLNSKAWAKHTSCSHPKALPQYLFPALHVSQDFSPFSDEKSIHSEAHFWSNKQLSSLRKNRQFSSNLWKPLNNPHIFMVEWLWIEETLSFCLQRLPLTSLRVSHLILVLSNLSSYL